MLELYLLGTILILGAFGFQTPNIRSRRYTFFPNLAASITDEPVESQWMERGLLISSFSDGILPNRAAHSVLRRDLMRVLLRQEQLAAEGAVKESAKFSPCLGPDIEAIDRMECLDQAIQSLDQFLAMPEDLFHLVANTPLRFVYIPTAMYAVRSESTNTPGKQRQRARADGKQRRNEIVSFLQMLLDLDVHVVTLDLDDGSVKQPEGSKDSRNFPKTGKDALSSWSPHLVYVQGGNTFWLYHCMEKGSWKDVILNLCTSGHSYYIGSSAGAIVAGARMETACWKGWDDPSVVPGRGQYSDWDGVKGLQLVGEYSFFPHMDSTWTSLVDDRGASGALMCLQDQDACFVDGRTRSVTVERSPSPALIL